MEIDLEEPTRPQIAAVLGCTSRWIGELRAQGDMPADGATMQENVEAWGAYKYGGTKAGDLDLDAERARLAKEQADAKEMDNAERRRELASLPDMTSAVIGVIALAVARLTQVPALIAGADHRLRQRIEFAINDALEGLSVTKVVAAVGGGFDEEEPDEGDE